VAATTSSGDGLVRWLIGGLVTGGIMLGLLVGAYEIGYHHGKQHGRRAAAATVSTKPSPPTATARTSTSPAGSSTTALVAEGRRLFSAEACSGCHSLNGSAGVGPTLKGVAGSTVTLADGTTVTADDRYLTESITTPDAQIVKGYQAGVMAAAVKSLNLTPDQITALIAYLKTQR
jgi:cytochrome c oxidase subunit 2